MAFQNKKYLKIHLRRRGAAICNRRIPFGNPVVLSFHPGPGVIAVGDPCWIGTKEPVEFHRGKYWVLPCARVRVRITAGPDHARVTQDLSSDGILKHRVPIPSDGFVSFNYGEFTCLIQFVHPPPYVRSTRKPFKGK